MGVAVRERKNEFEGCETWGVSTLAERYTVDTSRVSPLLPSYCFTSFSTVQARHHAPSPIPFPALLFTVMSQRSASLIFRFHILVYVSIRNSAVNISFTYSPVVLLNFLLYTKYRAWWSGIESRWGRDFPLDQTVPGVHPASCKMGIGSFSGVKCGRGVLLTTHPLLVPGSWKSRAIPLPTLWDTPDL